MARALPQPARRRRRAIVRGPKKTRCGAQDDAQHDGAGSTARATTLYHWGSSQSGEGAALYDRAPAAAGGFRPGDAASLTLGDEVTALFDLAEDAVALDGLAEARDQVLRRFAFSKVYCCHKCSVSARHSGCFFILLFGAARRYHTVSLVPAAVAGPERADGIPFLLLRRLEDGELLAQRALRAAA